MNNIYKLPYSDTIKGKLERLVDILIKELPDIELILLFGSYARADYKITSDIDIAVFTRQPSNITTRGYLCSIFDENNCDLVFYTKTQFHQSNCRLTNNIKKEGIVLWKK